VVDDGSTDQVADVCEGRPDVLLLSQARQGAPSARNAGLQRATSPFVLLLDSDDLLSPGFFPPRIRALQSNPLADGAYGPWVFFRGNEEFAESLVVRQHSAYPIYPWAERLEHIKNLVGGWYIPPHGMLWRRSALNRVGGQKPSLPVNQDVDLLFRILLTGPGIVGVPSAPWAIIRHHDGERQGVIGRSKAKLAAILELRKAFVTELREGELLDRPGMRENLARYCFNSWRTYRKVYPGIAEDFLELSRALFPGLVLPGKLPVRLASRILGAHTTAILRDLLG
jgi:glycosyltransferase involved in cell wall biosynthesis